VIKTDSPFRSPLALTLFVGMTIVGMGLDLWTKQLAFDQLAEQIAVVPDPNLPDGRVEVRSEEYDFIPNLLHFHVTANQGAVFGLGRGQRWLFVVVSIIAIAVLTSLFAHSQNRWFYQLLLGMLLAGVLGNMYDRIRLGYVRDMIYALPDWKNPLRGYFHDWQTVFPWIFNVADTLLCTGVFLMIVYSFFHKPENQLEPEVAKRGEVEATDRPRKISEAASSDQLEPERRSHSP
jgi:signal peptidase II